MKYEAIFHKEIEIQQFFGCFVWQMKHRSEGRSTIEVENVIFADFVLNCIDHSKFIYPLSITYNDRPDFVIKTEKKIIGVEITEQWSKNFGHAMSLSEHNDGFIELSDFNIDSDFKKLKGKKIAELVSKKKLTGPPSMGFQEEENWVKRTLKTTKNKTQKYKNYPNYKKFTDNYLVIFDVRPETPILDDVTEEMLSPLFSLKETTPFTKIFCMDSHIIEIDLIRKKIVTIRNNKDKKC